MAIDEERLYELRDDATTKEKLVLAIYAGAGGFAVACLISVVALPRYSWLVVAAACLFAIGAISLAFVVLSMYHVLHKTNDLHIGHVIISENFGKKPKEIAFASIPLGFLLLMLHISYLTFIVSLVSVILASRHFLRFKKELDSLTNLREFVKRERDA
ncbi:hypothetical protein RM531_02620 [Salinisphaera sp. P385]|uniref:Uncharacterized protein n=1 Tax=Spectribacter acetivorans TaxID=3075603 RepID=A0ABU3B685_9GAMM|nr:hypothetical protein [Salinisphaera sp. P385]MDT0617357.1 hypothetical protein [Salinisphaera sp. P385]